jgi:hypothetical protein
MPERLTSGSAAGDQAWPVLVSTLIERNDVMKLWLRRAWTFIVDRPLV